LFADRKRSLRLSGLLRKKEQEPWTLVWREAARATDDNLYDLTSVVNTWTSQPVERMQATARDRRYAQAMERVYATLPFEPTVATLYADALMNLTPWDWFEGASLNAPSAKARPNAEKAYGVLKRVLAAEPSHVGAMHLKVRKHDTDLPLYIAASFLPVSHAPSTVPRLLRLTLFCSVHPKIHLLEASTRLREADAQAAALATLVPGLAHLVHMPSHITIHEGRWAESARLNKAANSLGVDPAHNVYACHNAAFELWALRAAGRGEEALRKVRGVARLQQLELTAA